MGAQGSSGAGTLVACEHQELPPALSPAKAGPFPAQAAECPPLCCLEAAEATGAGAGPDCERQSCCPEGPQGADRREPEHGGGLADSEPRSRWIRAANKLKIIGKGTNGVEKENCVFLLPDHWLEIFDKRHRCHMKPYFKHWSVANTAQGFYEWLDHGDGKDIDLAERPRSVLEKQNVQYCSSPERDALEVLVDGGGLLRYKSNGSLVHTGSEASYLRRLSADGRLGVEVDLETVDEHSVAADGEEGREEEGEGEDEERKLEEEEELADLREEESCKWEEESCKWMVREGDVERSLDSSSLIRDGGLGGEQKKMKNRWIYVLDMDNRMFINLKIPGKFHHSSMSGGRPLLGAGSISVVHGKISIVTAWSGHYRPSHTAFAYVIDYLRDRGVDMSCVCQYYSKSEAGLKRSKSRERRTSRENDAANTELV